MAQKAFSISQTPPYTIPAELYDEAYRLYQRKYLLWKNWILEGILTLLTVDFIVTAVKDPSNGLTYFLMVLCVVLLALLIFSSRCEFATGDGCGERDGRIALCGSPLGTGNCDSDFDRGRAGRRNSADGVGI